MRVDSLIGTQVAQYRIDGLIGEGGMSRVYRAEHVVLRKRVALKLLAADLADDEVFRERFLRESQAAAALDHPNVIEIYDAGEADGLLYIAMRYIDGTDLRGLIKESGALPPERALELLRQAAAGLDVAHGRGLVHRDVKPANILIDLHKHVYLSDFGVAKYTADARGLTRSGFFVGTVDYAAPEQIRGEQLDGRADVYALGCLLYQCLSGELPYPRDSDVQLIYAHLEEPPPRLSDRGFPDRLDTVIATAMAKDREERYPTCGQVITAARAALSSAHVRPVTPPAVPAPPPPQSPPQPEPAPAPAPAQATSVDRPAVASPQPPPKSEATPGRRRRWILAGVAAALALGAAAVALLALAGGDDETVLPVVRGRVTDARTGKPVAGAVVRAADRSTRTARNGRFSLAQVSSGDQLAIESCAYGPATAEPAATIAVSLEPAPVTGRVTSDLTGAPVPGARVGPAKTRRDGSFTLIGACPGETVALSAPGHGRVRTKIADGRQIVAVLPARVATDAFAAGAGGLLPDAHGQEADGSRRGGEYHLAVLRRNWRAVQPTTVNKALGDARVDVTARFARGSPDDALGIVCRAAPDRYYVLEVSRDGFARIQKQVGTRAVTLRDWRRSPALRPGTANRLSATCTGTGVVNVRLATNGVTLASARDANGLPAGGIGLAAARFGAAPTEAVFDNFRLSRV